MYRGYPMLPFYESIGAIPSSYLVSLSYEEQILWLCSQIKAIKEGTPNFNYELLENKPLINGIELIGNKTLSDLGIQQKLVAGDGIDITGNVISSTGGSGEGGTNNLLYEYDNTTIINGSYYNLDVPLGTEVSLTPVYAQNTSRAFIEGVKVNDRFKVVGDYKAGIVYPQGNILLHKEDGEYDSFYCMTDGDLVISWYNTDQQAPKLYRYITGNDVIDRLADDEQDIFNLNENKMNKVQDLTQNMVLTTEDSINVTSTGFYNTGEYGIYLNSATLNNTLFGTEEIVYIDKENKIIHGSTQFAHYDSEESTWYIQDIARIDQVLTNSRNKIPTSEAVYNAIQGITPSGNVMNSLSANLILTVGSPINVTSTGFYNTGEYGIYLNSATLSNVLFGPEEIVYIDKENNLIHGSTQFVAYNNVDFQWYIQDISRIEQVLTNSRNKIPTSEAVYNAIQGGVTPPDVFYTVIDQDVTLNANGTSNYNFENGKYYFMNPTRQLRYYDDDPSVSHSTRNMDGAILYYEEDYVGGTLVQKVLHRTGVNNDLADVSNESLTWTPERNYWNHSYSNYLDYVSNSYTSHLSSTRSVIPDTGREYDIPTIEAVRNYVYDSAIAYEDITNQINYTASSGVTVSTFTAYKKGNNVTIILTTSYTRTNAGIKQLLSISNLTPKFQSYGIGTSYAGTVGASGAFGRITTEGVVSGITLIENEQVTLNIEFPLA